MAASSVAEVSGKLLENMLWSVTGGEVSQSTVGPTYSIYQIVQAKHGLSSSDEDSRAWNFATSSISYQFPELMLTWDWGKRCQGMDGYSLKPGTSTAVHSGWKQGLQKQGLKQFPRGHRICVAIIEWDSEGQPGRLNVTLVEPK